MPSIVLTDVLTVLSGTLASRTGAGGETDDSNIKLADRQATAVFRVVQESLTNVARHAVAQEVIISLKQVGQHLRLVVKDDGRGFTMKAGVNAASFGLLGMGERMLAIGGSLHINSAPGRGTAISINPPLVNGDLSSFVF
jgi:signal transduction histidine kinase